MSHFGELPDVGFQKFHKKRKKTQSNSQDLAIFVKSTSGSTKIRHFRFFGVFEQFLAKPHLVARQNLVNRKSAILMLPDVAFSKNRQTLFFTLNFGIFEQSNLVTLGGILMFRRIIEVSTD